MLIVKEAQIRGSFAYRRADFARAIDLLESGSVPTDALVTGVVSSSAPRRCSARCSSPTPST